MEFRTNRLGLIDLAAVAQEKRLSDTPCSTLEGYGEGPQRAANGQDSWGFFKDAQGLGRTAGCWLVRWLRQLKAFTTP